MICLAQPSSQFENPVHHDLIWGCIFQNVHNATIIVNSEREREKVHCVDPGPDVLKS